LGLGTDMRRREFITALGGAAAALPFWGARAQGNAVRSIGLLDPGLPELFAAFQQSMRELGYIEGQNVSYLRFSAEGRPERIPQLASELIARTPDVIVTAGPLPVHAVLERTSTIPLVFAALGDAVGSGVVSNLAHPGGNVTGFSFLNTELSEKRLELLRDMLPGLQRVVLLADAATSSPAIESTEAAARRLSLTTNLLKIKGPDDFETAFSSASENHFQAMDVFSSPFFNSNRARLIDLALKYKLPAIYDAGEYVRDGGLMAYGPNFLELFRRAASYVHRILGGTKAGDLPVEQPTKFELAINLKTAKAISLTVPEPFLLRADNIVE
jgi:putative tryptophan/tyrosine transport system substrate-binding protein